MVLGWCCVWTCFWLMQYRLVLDWFISLLKNKGSSFCFVCSKILMNWFLLPLSPNPHVILHAGLARSCRIHCFKKWKITCSLGRKSPLGRMSGCGKCSSQALTHPLRRSPLSRRARVNLWMLDSATSPSAPRRMTAFLEVFRFHI